MPNTIRQRLHSILVLADRETLPKQQGNAGIIADMRLGRIKNDALDALSLLDAQGPTPAAPPLGSDPVKVRTMIGAEAAYACIEHSSRSLDVRLSPGKSPAASLFESAESMRHDAAVLMRRAELIERAAHVLEHERGAAKG